MNDLFLLLHILIIIIIILILIHSSSLLEFICSLHRGCRCLAGIEISSPRQPRCGGAIYLWVQSSSESSKRKANRSFDSYSSNLTVFIQPVVSAPTSSIRIRIPSHRDRHVSLLLWSATTSSIVSLGRIVARSSCRSVAKSSSPLRLSPFRAQTISRRAEYEGTSRIAAGGIRVSGPF